MPNPPDTEYFIYFYIFACEKCHCPYRETRLIAKTPQDSEIDRMAAEWYCENCGAPNSTAFGDRSALYVRKLLVKSGKCSERRNGGIVNRP